MLKRHMLLNFRHLSTTYRPMGSTFEVARAPRPYYDELIKLLNKYLKL